MRPATQHESVLRGRLYAYLGIPGFAAILTFLAVVTPLVWWWHEPVDQDSVVTAAVFGSGALAGLGIGVRAWRRQRRGGDPTAPGAAVARRVPLLVGVGVVGGLAMAANGLRLRQLNLEQRTQWYCDRPHDSPFADCRARARACLVRHAAEDAAARAVLGVSREVELCITGERQTQRQD